MTLTFTSSNTATLDRPASVLIRLRVEDGVYIADDMIGSQYGSGDTPAKALAEWAEAVSSLRALVAANDCGPRLKREARAYAAALDPDEEAKP